MKKSFLDLHVLPLTAQFVLLLVFVSSITLALNLASEPQDDRTMAAANQLSATSQCSDSQQAEILVLFANNDPTRTVINLSLTADAAPTTPTNVTNEIPPGGSEKPVIQTGISVINAGNVHVKYQWKDNMATVQTVLPYVAIQCASTNPLPNATAGPSPTIPPLPQPTFSCLGSCDPAILTGVPAQPSPARTGGSGRSGGSGARVPSTCYCFTSAYANSCRWCFLLHCLDNTPT